MRHAAIAAVLAVVTLETGIAPSHAGEEEAAKAIKTFEAFETDAPPGGAASR